MKRKLECFSLKSGDVIVIYVCVYIYIVGAASSLKSIEITGNVEVSDNQICFVQLSQYIFGEKQSAKLCLGKINGK